jgi:hypothetical protein
MSYPVTDCELCGGRGWYCHRPHPDYPDDDTQYLERYCECEAGQRRMRRDGVEP